ncbi:Hypothetical predicted protein, partial [Pelobates cultripes]
MALDHSVLLKHLQWMMELLSHSSCLSPSQRMEFLKFTVDSEAESLNLPPFKIQTIRKELHRTL